MSIATEQVAEAFLNIVAGTPVNCSWPLYAEDEVEVIYGSASLRAILNTDFTVQLSDPDYDTFTVTPLASLITKINALIADDAEEINRIVVRRVLDYLTSVTPETVRYTTFLSREIERIHMRLQQLKESVLRGVGLAATDVGDEDDVVTITRPVAGATIIGNDDETGFTTGPTVTEISNAQAASETAVAAAAAAEATLDAFTDLYLGAKASDPALDNDGDALINGAFYFNTTINRLKIYDGVDWSVAVSDDSNDINYLPVFTGATTRALSDKISDIVSIKDFGAVGDDSTDDTAAIQAAIDYAGQLPSNRQRMVYVPPGVYLFTELTVDNAYTGLTIVGDNYWTSNLKCSEDSSTPAITCEAQEFKLQNVSLISSFGYADNHATGKIGLVLDKGVGETADIDATIQNCRISAWENAVYIRGRGLRVQNCIMSVNHDSVALDWYDLADYVEGSQTSQKDATGFRGIIITGNRFHSHANSAVANTGTNAAKLNGLLLTDNLVDIGRRLFHGHLGKQALISGFVVNQTPDPAFELTGGDEFLITNGVIAGDPVEGRIGLYLINMSGSYNNGMFSNLSLSHCERHAIFDQSTILDNVKFSNIDFNDVCTDVSSFKPIAITSQNGTIDIENIRYNSSTTLAAVIDNNFSNNTVRARNIVCNGNATPHTEGVIKEFETSSNGWQAYSGSITWTGTTPPSGADINVYSWTKIGNLVTLQLLLGYAVAGAALTIVRAELPAGAPTPVNPTGWAGAGNQLYAGAGGLSTGITQSYVTSRASIQRNAGDTAYEVEIIAASGAYSHALATVQYFTNS